MMELLRSDMSNQVECKKPRGVFEKPKESGIWWIRYVDAAGKLRREKVGPKGAAIMLVEKRRTDARLKLKLPEKFRVRRVLFRALAGDVTKHHASSSNPKT